MDLYFCLYYGSPIGRFDLEMSLAPIMLGCPRCNGKPVFMYLALYHSQRPIRYKNVCERCGGSGRVTYTGNY
jgi:hypothetical protein